MDAISVLTCSESSPFQSHREAAQAYAELKKYMLEMKEAKARELGRSQRNQESNILGNRTHHLILYMAT
jgi:hypothetical protein